MFIAQTMLWLTAAIWGFAFVAQSMAMDHVGPHTFNAGRFVLACLSLLPLLLVFRNKTPYKLRDLILGGLLTGTIMFFGFTFQQIGLLYTTAGNAGFITSMYLVLVPVLGLFMGQKTRSFTWFGVALALIGLYNLTITSDLSLNPGDGLELIGTLFWALHVISIGFLANRLPAIPLSIMQFAVAAVWASSAAFLFEVPSFESMTQAWIPLLYTGIASSGIACTLQILGQRKVSASISALILSTEALFATMGGWLIMGEVLSAKELTGCGLILAGLLVSQWPQKKNETTPPSFSPQTEA